MKYQNIIDNMTLKEKAAFPQWKKRVADKRFPASGYPGDFLFRRTEWCA